MLSTIYGHTRRASNPPVGIKVELVWKVIAAIRAGDIVVGSRDDRGTEGGVADDELTEDALGLWSNSAN